MAKRVREAEPSLFDLFDRVDPNPSLAAPLGDCAHEREKTITIWPGETFERLTWTCKLCGFIWGRA